MKLVWRLSRAANELQPTGLQKNVLHWNIFGFILKLFCPNYSTLAMCGEKQFLAVALLPKTSFLWQNKIKLGALKLVQTLRWTSSEFNYLRSSKMTMVDRRTLYYYFEGETGMNLFHFELKDYVENVKETV